METSSVNSSSSDPNGPKNSDELSKTQDRSSEDQSPSSVTREQTGEAASAVAPPSDMPLESGLPTFDLAFTGEDLSAGEDGEDEDAGEYEEPLAAMPSIPDVANEDLTVEVSSSPAFVSLDQVCISLKLVL